MAKTNSWSQFTPPEETHAADIERQNQAGRAAEENRQMREKLVRQANAAVNLTNARADHNQTMRGLNHEKFLRDREYEEGMKSWLMKGAAIAAGYTDEGAQSARILTGIPVDAFYATFEDEENRLNSMQNVYDFFSYGGAAGKLHDLGVLPAGVAESGKNFSEMNSEAKEYNPGFAQLGKILGEVRKFGAPAITNAFRDWGNISIRQQQSSRSWLDMSPRQKRLVKRAVGDLGKTSANGGLGAFMMNEIENRADDHLYRGVER